MCSGVTCRGSREGSFPWCTLSERGEVGQGGVGGAGLGGVGRRWEGRGVRGEAGCGMAGQARAGQCKVGQRRAGRVGWGNVRWGREGQGRAGRAWAGRRTGDVAVVTPLQHAAPAHLAVVRSGIAINSSHARSTPKHSSVYKNVRFRAGCWNNLLSAVCVFSVTLC